MIGALPGKHLSYWIDTTPRTDYPALPGVVAADVAVLGGCLVGPTAAVLGLSEQRLERLKTAVAEATMNAMEHGNRYRREVPVVIEVLSSGADLSVRINDQGGSLVPDPDTEVPDLEAKLEGMQTPRGWGLFLIRNMVDEMHITSDEARHTVGLVMHLEGGEDAG
jgi:serine/threonine-protein kinase RsbW